MFKKIFNYPEYLFNDNTDCEHQLTLIFNNFINKSQEIKNQVEENEIVRRIYIAMSFSVYLFDLPSMYNYYKYLLEQHILKYPEDSEAKKDLEALNITLNYLNTTESHIEYESNLRDIKMRGQNIIEYIEEQIVYSTISNEIDNECNIKYITDLKDELMYLCVRYIEEIKLGCIHELLKISIFNNSIAELKLLISDKNSMPSYDIVEKFKYMQFAINLNYKKNRYFNLESREIASSLINFLKNSKIKELMNKAMNAGVCQKLNLRRGSNSAKNPYRYIYKAFANHLKVINPGKSVKWLWDNKTIDYTSSNPFRFNGYEVYRDGDYVYVEANRVSHNLKKSTFLSDYFGGNLRATSRMQK